MTSSIEIRQTIKTEFKKIENQFNFLLEYQISVDQYKIKSFELLEQFNNNDYSPKLLENVKRINTEINKDFFDKKNFFIKLIQLKNELSKKDLDEIINQLDLKFILLKEFNEHYKKNVTKIRDFYENIEENKNWALLLFALSRLILSLFNMNIYFTGIKNISEEINIFVQKGSEQYKLIELLLSSIEKSIDTSDIRITEIKISLDNLIETETETGIVLASKLINNKIQKIISLKTPINKLDELYEFYLKNFTKYIFFSDIQKKIETILYKKSKKELNFTKYDKFILNQFRINYKEYLIILTNYSTYINRTLKHSDFPIETIGDLKKINEFLEKFDQLNTSIE